MLRAMPDPRQAAPTCRFGECDGGGVCRHNPARVSHELYARRLAEKGWRERWPRLRLFA